MLGKRDTLTRLKERELPAVKRVSFWGNARKAKYEPITWPALEIHKQDSSVVDHIRTLYETEISIPRLFNLLLRTDSKLLIYYVVETNLISIFDNMEQIPKDTARFLVDVMQNWINEATKLGSFQPDETPSMLGFLLWRGFIEICSARSTEIQKAILDFIQSFCYNDQSGLSLVEISAFNGIKDFMSLDYDSKTEHNWYKHVYFPVLIEIHHQYCVSGGISQSLRNFLGDLLDVFPFLGMICSKEPVTKRDEHEFQCTQCEVQIFSLFTLHLWLLSNIANDCTLQYKNHNFVIQPYFPGHPMYTLATLPNFEFTIPRTRSQLNLLKERRIRESEHLPHVGKVRQYENPVWIFESCFYLLNHIVPKKEINSQIWQETSMIFANPAFQLNPLKLNQLVLASYIHRLLKYCCPGYPANLQSRECFYMPRDGFNYKAFSKYTMPVRLPKRENRKLLTEILQNMIGELHHDILGFAQASLHRIHMMSHEQCVLPEIVENVFSLAVPYNFEFFEEGVRSLKDGFGNMRFCYKSLDTLWRMAGDDLLGHDDVDFQEMSSMVDSVLQYKGEWKYKEDEQTPEFHMWSLENGDQEPLCVIRAFVSFETRKLLLYAEFIEMCDYWYFRLGNPLDYGSAFCCTICSHFPPEYDRRFFELIPALNAHSAVPLLYAIKHIIDVVVEGLRNSD